MSILRKLAGFNSDKNQISKAEAMGFALSQIATQAADQDKKLIIDLFPEFDFKITMDLELLMLHYVMVTMAANYYLKDKHLMKATLDKFHEIIIGLYQNYISTLKENIKKQNPMVQNMVKEQLKEYYDVKSIYNNRDKQYRPFFETGMSQINEDEIIMLGRNIMKNLSEKGKDDFEIAMTMPYLFIERMNFLKKYLEKWNNRHF